MGKNFENGEDTYVCNLSLELQEKAKKELNERRETRARDISSIRMWMKKQPHLPNKTGDRFILEFLRSSKFSLEETKDRIDKYFTIKTAIPEWFLNRDPRDETHLQILSNGHFLPLRHFDKEGRRVIIMNGGFNPDDIDSVQRSISMIGEIMTWDEQTEICGCVFVVDAAIIPYRFLKIATPTLIKKFLFCAQDCIPMRIAAAHVVNMPGWFETVLNMFKSMMKEKLRNRIYIHNSLEALHENLGKEIFPQEYGGTAGTLSDLIDYWKEECMEYREALLNEDVYTTDETKRPGKPKTASELFGFDGSFRKLDID